MLAWLKQFFITSTPRKPSALETAFLAQSKAIADVMKRQQDLIAQQQSTLDRIVTAKYDRPIALPAQVIPSDRMPDWAMTDQGDVLEPDFAAAIRSIAVESDSEFMSAVGAR